MRSRRRPAPGGLMIAVAVLAAVAARAHPGVGIVQDDRGNVYFTDLKQVWRITPAGAKSVAVPSVHTHELYLDAEGTLYGEHVWYEGDATKKWGFRVWSMRRDGALSDVITARRGFLRDYSFVRDRAGNMYWADGDPRTIVMKRAPGAAASAVHATGGFRDVRWMTATADGTLFLIDRGDLRRISPAGEVTTQAARLSAHQPAPAEVADRHYHMGLWTDGAGVVHVAVAGERLVLRVEADGARTVVARSPLFWAPSGGLFDQAGDLWLLESSLINQVRVRRIGRDGRERIF